MHRGYTIEDTALLEAARTLGRQIEAHADQIEQDRFLPQPLIDAIVKAGLFKILVPREMGGSEASPSTLVRVIEEVSRFDASVGWCVCFGAVNGISSGCLPAYVAKDIFAQDDHACMAASAAPAPPAEDRPPHRATVVDGGYRVSGRWAFASGCMHATWLIGSAPIYAGESPRIGPNGQPETRFMFFPREACQIIDTWDVTGMRGTGSHDFAVVDVFVGHSAPPS
jgi:alkylation response protein AidB-like acyl-CoA dehydrogenase